jgi:glycosyltransferase involved in cell wall biosynthesis
VRLAHVTATFPPYLAGTGNVAWHQARELAALGHRVDVLTAAPASAAAGPPLAPPGVRVRRLRPLARVGNAPLLPQLPGLLRGYDLLHLHEPFFGGGELLWLAARLFATPYVVTYHNDVVLAGPLAPLPGLRQRLIGRRLLAEARLLLFTTLDYGRASFVADLARGPRARALPNGVDVERFRPYLDGRSIRARFGIAPDRALALFVGALDRAHHFKGLDVLFRALARLDDLPLDLLVVGDGDLRPEYERRVAAAGLGGRLRFAGRVDDAELPQCYAASDLVVLPSVGRGEAFGMVLLEGLACGKPVVASDLPGVRSVVQATGGGLVVPPGDADALARALAALARAPEWRRALGQVGRTTVERDFAWPILSRRLETLYYEALGEGVE